MDIVFLIKPLADEDRRRQLEGCVARLRSQGHDVRVVLPRKRGDGRRLAAAASRSGCDIVVAVGGDGTVNEVANGLGDAACAARLGIVPFGTANDFSRGLGIPEDVDAAVGVAIDGEPRSLDLGCVNGHYFVNVSTGGFGARATAEVSRALKRRFGALAYLFAGARQLIELKAERAQFIADGNVVHDGEFVFFAVGNGRRTGGGTRITPRASIRDGELDVVILPGISRLDFLSLLPDLRAGNHIENPDVLYLRASRLLVYGETELAVNIDGEPLCERDLTYTVHPQPLEVMVPHGNGEREERASGKQSGPVR